MSTAVTCEFCRKVFEVNPSRSNKARFCSHRCHGDHLLSAKTKVCRVCKLEKLIEHFPLKNKKGSRSSHCRPCLRVKMNRLYAEKYARPRVQLSSLLSAVCRACGLLKPIGDFKRVIDNTNGGYKNYRRCLDCYRQASRERYAEDPQRNINHVLKRHATKLGAPVVEDINRDYVIKKDKSTCYLCNTVLNPEEITLDHVIPLTKGGCHTHDNLRVACRSCNSRKGNKLLVELSWYTGVGENVYANG